MGLIALDILRVAGQPERASFRAGGTAGNVAAILGSLGWPAQAAGPADGSRASSLLLDDLQRCGVEYHARDGACVPVIVEELGMGAQHHFLFDCPVCGRELPRYRRDKFAAGIDSQAGAYPFDVFFADRLSDAILALAGAARNQGAFVVYEPSDPADEPWAGAMFALADMVKYSGDRASALPWLQAGDYLEVRTSGAQGLQWRWPGKAVPGWRSMEAVRASRVVDTCGAGDWLTAGILVGLLEPLKCLQDQTSPSVLEEVLRSAQHLAAWSTGYAGARGALYESGPAVARTIMQRAAPAEPDPFGESTAAVTCLVCQA
ncbi:PfkB family carbohydrate kinase [Metallibacterium sp.]|uniref:PfkB family carbohydrate kinase n=1 Tax=Metallibacterium sp. TaxID=2940281 RepID=UPI0026137BA6|nr:PfkB family carbohydrate kinase [Metallibacterium sp.]